MPLFVCGSIVLLGILAANHRLVRK